MSEEEHFTNRHGHTITALQEAVNTLPEPEYKTAAPKPQRRRKTVLFRPSRRQLQVAGIILLVVLIVPVLVGEYVRATYGGNISDAKGKVQELFSSVQQQQQSGVTSKLLTDTSNKLSTIRDGLCPGEFLDNIAKLYPRATSAYDECATYRSSLGALNDRVVVAAEQLAYLERLQPLITGISQPIEDQFAILSAQQENWQDFVDGLKRLSVPLTFNAAHAGLVKEAEAVRDQWIALVQASNAQESAAFRTARTKLTESYAAFRAQTSQFSSAVAASQISLSTSVLTLK